MRSFLELIEQKETVIFTFGRFNPPTTGHEKLIQKAASVAGSSPFRVYPSYSQNQKKDPLPFALKIAYMRKMFSKYARNIIADKDARTVINVAVKLYDQGFKNLIMVAGSDRVKEFSSLLNNYNGVEGKRHGFYKFDSIDVVSAGDRDPDSEGVSGMSASKMRAAASDGDFDSFKQGVPSNFKDAKKLFLDVRKYMGIREERNMGEMNDFETLRDNYLTGKIWNINDLIEANGVEGKIIRRGTNYVAFNDKDGKVHKAWLHEIRIDPKTSSEKDIKQQAQNVDIKRLQGILKDRGFKEEIKQPVKSVYKFTEFRNFNYKPLLNEKIEALVKKSKESDISYSTLKKVYDRGMGAYKTNPQSVRPNVTSPQQWALARVNSFIKRGHKQDDDLREDIKINSWGEITEKDDKSGKELNNPTRGDIKKYKVYVKNDKGNVVKVEFGDPDMEIKRDDPERRKAFRARHDCDNPGPKWKAKYWSCKFWSGKSVTDLMKG